MKKLLSVLLAVSMLLSMSTMAAENKEYPKSQRSIYVDGAYIDVNNIVIDDKEYLPLKKLCDILGYDIKEISENTYEITEGENCRNSEGATGRAVFTVGDDYVTTYSKDGQYENKIETFPAEPMIVEIGDEIYISSYYFGRMFEIETRFTDDMKIALYTVNNRKEQTINAPRYNGNIFVKTLNEEIQIEVDGESLKFTDKLFIDADGRTQVPVREFCEQMNFSVYWYEDIKTVAVSSVTPDLDKSNGGGAGGANIRFVIGERGYMFNGTEYDMDTEAKIFTARTYIPLRYLAEALNYYVAYNPGSPANIDIGYGYSVMNSYLGLSRELVMKEMGIDENNLLKIGDEAYPVRQHQEGSMYIVRNGYKKGHVVIEFYNNVLCAFYYVFKTEGEAFNEASGMYDYLVKLHGEPTTYPGTEKTISGIEPDESIYNSEGCSYYDEWHTDASKELIETLLGDSDNGLVKLLRLDINPHISSVRVSFGKDVNFHNRNVVED